MISIKYIHQACNDILGPGTALPSVLFIAISPSPRSFLESKVPEITFSGTSTDRSNCTQGYDGVPSKVRAKMCDQTSMTKDAELRIFTRGQSYLCHEKIENNLMDMFIIPFIVLQCNERSRIVSKYKSGVIKQ